MKRLLAALCLLPFLAHSASTTTTVLSSVTVYEGTGTNDNETVIQTGDVQQYNAFCLMSTTGAMDVFVSAEPDAGNYSTSALSLIDQGATSSDPVVVTVANRYYCFRGKFLYVRVLQNGATAVANATLIAGVI